MNKKLVLAVLCVVAFGPSVKADLKDTLTGAVSTAGDWVQWVVDAPANTVFKDGSWVSNNTHQKVSLVSRLGLTAYVAYALSKEERVKKVLDKLPKCCRRK